MPRRLEVVETRYRLAGLVRIERDALPQWRAWHEDLPPRWLERIDRQGPGRSPLADVLRAFLADPVQQGPDGVGPQPVRDPAGGVGGEDVTAYGLTPPAPSARGWSTSFSSAMCARSSPSSACSPAHSSATSGAAPSGAA